MWGTRTTKGLLALGLLFVVSCSSDDADPDEGASEVTTATTAAADGDTATTTTAAPEVVRPDGPVADISEEITGGIGVNVASSSPPDDVLAEAGYEQVELVAAGTATSYVPVGELTGDGRWTLEEGDTADYRTRIVVRRPADPADFSGTVAVEWLNVSGGLDADPDWQMLHEELTRSGDIWVGVSAQVIGVNGGPVAVTTPASEAGGAGRGLRNLDPERYGTLDHPGDGFAYDIYTQVARAVREGGPALGGAEPERLIAVGESQSAFALVTYVNGVQPLTAAFDGFFVHSRGGTALPLDAGTEGAGIADAIAGTPTALRTDGDAPILELQSESDVTGILGSFASRQDDDDRFRLWEIAGTAHADTRLVGDGSIDLGCGAINDGPMHLVAKAGFHALVEWVTSGTLPPEAPRLDVTAGPPPAQTRDEDGIATGGIRTPLVDVPVDVLSGDPAPGTTAIVCILSGSTTPLPPEYLLTRYASADDYTAQFEASADETIAAGFVLEADREALLAYADPSRIG